MSDRTNDDEKMKEMKRVYEGMEMSPAQLEMMKLRMDQAKERRSKSRRMRTIRQWSAVAAALLLFITLPNTSQGVAHAMEGIPFLGRLVSMVTFRNYQYEDDRNHADIQVPFLVTVGQDTDAGAAAPAGSVPDTEEDAVQRNLRQTTEEINQEIGRITDDLTTEFKEGLKERQSYQSMEVQSEILATTEDFFTLKLTCYQASGSGAEWNYYYTIDLQTGQRIALKDLFREGADYLTAISENIKEQMQQQMAADENVAYWLNDPEVPEWNFVQITEETSFYLNQEGLLVISFDEGEVAPMYMGCVQFVIPDTILDSLK